MTIVYVPRLIESAEQAEALPDGTVLIREGHYAYQKGDGAPGSDYVDGGPETAVGWSALVPIEAEEETVRDISPEVGAFSFDDEIPEKYLGPPRTRYVTPWEAV